MELNQDGIDLVKHFEGCKLKAYPDPATGGAPWTIGFGSTGPNVRPGLVWSQALADKQLEIDLMKLSERMKAVIHEPCTDNEFSAMVCLAYNIGIGAFKTSTLLKLVNMNNKKLAAEEFKKWSKAAGKVMPGLVARRDAERVLFLS